MDTRGTGNLELPGPGGVGGKIERRLSSERKELAEHQGVRPRRKPDRKGLRWQHVTKRRS